MAKKLFISHGAHEGQGNFPEFAESMRNLGYELTENLRVAQLVVAFNHNKKMHHKFNQRSTNGCKTVLVRLEPRSVFPGQYQKKVEDSYNLVVSMGSTITGNQIVRWPYFVELNPLKPNPKTRRSLYDVTHNLRKNEYTIKNWQERDYWLTFIASNKVSAVSGTNYGVRRKFVRELSKYGMRTYGALWHGDRTEQLSHRLSVVSHSMRNLVIPNPREIWGDFHRSYSGTYGNVANKHQILGQSRFSLVIENDSTYVSEKLIDVLISGSLPLYMGGDIEKVGIPVDLVQKVSSSSQVLEFCRDLSSDEVVRRLNLIRNLVTSKKFLEQWSGEQVFKQLAEIIHRNFEG